MHDLAMHLESVVAPHVHDAPDIGVVRRRASRRRRQRRVRIAVAGLVLAALAFASVALVRAGTSPTSSRPVPPAGRTHGRADATRVTYPADLVAGSRRGADLLYPNDPVRFSEDDGSPPVFAAKEDLVLSMVARLARQQGLPYDNWDLLVPMRNASGALVGYMGGADNKLLTPEEVASPDFDPCAVEMQRAEKQDAAMRAWQAREPELFAGLPEPPTNAREQVRCHS